ncbi:uncharacterized protein LOC121945456 isoform X1 [Plectropomus leopardus]|uniref:uncharacterized protein LOC121945456 isoform X1 n=1 Tax=Plectropomus leopardus TaxID=160734 RepID=UPI001C4AE92B|nr:uncharacterized protein LOC121945456 isoform X1 [Plectropomus leopardus]
MSLLGALWMQCFTVASRGSLLSLQRGICMLSCPATLLHIQSETATQQAAKYLGDRALVLLYCAAMATTETMFPDRSDFDYDYETLRTTGVVLAVVMFFSGIFIALSKKFTKCVKSSSNSSSSGTQIPKTDVPPQTV